MTWIIRVYLLGAAWYGSVVLVCGILDKEVPRKTLYTAMLFTPIWPVIVYMVIRNIQKNGRN